MGWIKDLEKLQNFGHPVEGLASSWVYSFCELKSKSTVTLVNFTREA